MKTITITITVPDGVDFTPQVTTTAQNGPQAAAAPQAAPAGAAPACPRHGADRVKTSKFGGWYCTAADDSEEKGYCAWKQK